MKKIIRILESDSDYWKVFAFIIVMHTLSGYNNNLLSFGLNLMHGNLFINALMITLAELTAHLWSFFKSNAKKPIEVYRNQLICVLAISILAAVIVVVPKVLWSELT